MRTPSNGNSSPPSVISVIIVHAAERKKICRHSRDDRTSDGSEGAKAEITSRDHWQHQHSQTDQAGKRPRSLLLIITTKPSP